MEFFHKQTNFPFMAHRKVWYGLSAVLMIICFASFWIEGLNLALDFTGGVAVEVTFTGAADVEKVRSALERGWLPRAAGADVRHVARRGDSPAGRRTRRSEEIKKQHRGCADAARRQARRCNPPEIVGSQVGEELRTSAIWALAFTLLCIFIYLAFRFHTGACRWAPSSPCFTTRSWCSACSRSRRHRSIWRWWRPCWRSSATR